MGGAQDSPSEPPQAGALGEGDARLSALGVGLLCLGLLLGLFLGRASLSPSEVLSAVLSGPHAEEGASTLILWWVRLPQTLTALIAGAALGASGAALQSIFRNPLADPYLLGVSSGGGVGASVVIVSGVMEWLGLWSVAGASFLGALMSTGLIYAWSRGRESVLSLERLILVGVALNLMLSALLTLTLSLSEGELAGAWRWLLGRVDGLSWLELGWLALPALLGTALLIKHQRALWLLEGGEEVAWSLGVPTERLKRLTLWASALAVGGVVAFCGVIGFVGLMAPHFVRPRLNDSARLVERSALFGAAGLCLCDALGRLSPQPLPVGVITGCLGGLTLLWALRHEGALGGAGEGGGL